MGWEATHDADVEGDFAFYGRGLGRERDGYGGGHVLCEYGCCEGEGQGGEEGVEFHLWWWLKRGIVGRFGVRGRGRVGERVVGF